MAHEITRTDTMFSASGITPWHGLGTVLDAPPTIAEALRLSGLDWRVKTTAAYAYVERNPMAHARSGLHEHERVFDLRRIPSQGVVREDTGEILGSVGPSWTPVQNRDAFKWFQPWIDSGKIELETAGSLRGGRKVWILARITSDPIVVQGDDVVNKYVLLAHAHDGSMAIHAGLTAVRVVCANTLAYAVREDRKDRGLFRLAHTKNVRARLDDVAEKIEEIDARLNKAGDLYRELASREIRGGTKTIAEFVAATYQQPLDEVMKEGARRLTRIERLLEEGQGQDLPGARGTWWGLYNAVTEAETHGSGTETSRARKARESRANRNTLGDGAGLLERALDNALTMSRGYSVDEVFGIGSAASTLAAAAHPEAIHAVA